MPRNLYLNLSIKTLLHIALLVITALPAFSQQFTEVVPGLPEKLYPCVAVGDYDGDGDLDVLVAANGKHDIPFTTVYKNTGGVFSDSGIVLLGLSRATAAWGDFDGDGDLDLAMTGVENNGAFTGPPRTRIYRNDGGIFTALPGNFLGVFAGGIAWGDYDGDGKLDLLVTGVTATSAQGVPITRLYHNDGNDVFTSVAHPFPNCLSGNVAWADYNNDGRLDVIITGSSDTQGLVAAIWRNDGGGNFTNIGASLPGTDLGFAAWGDYDNDGDLDLLFGGNSNDGWISRVYRNDNGTFTDASVGMLGVIWSSAAWGDYDNDGDLDAMVIGYDPVAQVTRSILYRNDAGTFVDSGSTFHDLYLGAVNWMDYDNDGKLDLLLTGNTSGTDVLRIYRNNNATQDTAPSAPTNLAVNVLGTSVEVSWNAASDTQTPPAGLSYNWRVGTAPGGSDIVAPQSSIAGYRRLAAMGNVQSHLGARLRGLVPGATYYWSVQSVDTAFAGSAFAAEGFFTALADPPQNVSFTRDAGGAIHATWRGTPGSTYRVDVSPDLQSWTPATTPVAAAGTGAFDFFETPPANATRRFFRAARP